MAIVTREDVIEQAIRVVASIPRKPRKNVLHYLDEGIPQIIALFDLLAPMAKMPANAHGFWITRKEIIRRTKISCHDLTYYLDKYESDDLITRKGKVVNVDASQIPNWELLCGLIAAQQR